MKKWCTEFMALDALTGQMKKWCGPEIDAPTANLAQQWCYENAGHLKVVGELVAEIPCKSETYAPDWSKMIDYENIQQN